MSIKLAILGLLMEGDSYPYEIVREMKDRQMHKYVKIQYGTFYYAIDQLKKDGYIASVEVISSGSRPDKTIYRITDAGKELFHRLLLEQMEGEPHLNHPMFIALIFASYGDQAKIAEILAQKMPQWEAEAEQMLRLYEEHVGQVSRAVLHTLWVGYEHLLTELNWRRRLLADALAGRLNERGEGLKLKPYEEADSPI
ncbi:PadR family transcriptional regulator [Paenibacillus sp. GCM10027626]|uniref:PadR family transcriptional regulator n=1 Tax=Paenibacillus sp. GCM10027626 TaxID=3273411 RepID=UPI003632A1B9